MRIQSTTHKYQGCAGSFTSTFNSSSHDGLNVPLNLKPSFINNPISLHYDKTIGTNTPPRHNLLPQWPHFHYGKSRAATLAPAGRQYQRSLPPWRVLPACSPAPKCNRTACRTVSPNKERFQELLCIFRPPRTTHARQQRHKRAACLIHDRPSRETRRRNSFTNNI